MKILDPLLVFVSCIVMIACLLPMSVICGIVWAYEYMQATIKEYRTG